MAKAALDPSFTKYFNWKKNWDMCSQLSVEQSSYFLITVKKLFKNVTKLPQELTGWNLEIEGKLVVKPILNWLELEYF